MLGLLIGCFLFLAILFGLNRLFGYNELTNPYECGFYPYKSNKISTFVQLWGLVVTFIAFEIELLILLPISLTGFTLPVVLFLSILILFYIIKGLLFIRIKYNVLFIQT